MRTMLAEGTSDQYIMRILTNYYEQGVGVDEMLGFLDALEEVAVSVNLKNASVIDLCGTGGDGKNTFNISTTAAFVVAGAGIPVAKHGNSAFSSSIGSSDVLMALGVQLNKEISDVARDLADHGICFLHAPFFHPRLKGLAAIRKKLGHATIFNLLGPLLNPVKPRFQCLGVKSPDLIDIYTNVLKDRGVQFSVIHSFDGYDEISLTGEFLVASSKASEVYSPEQLGLLKCRAEDLRAPESLTEAAELIENVLQCKGTREQEAVVTANAGFAISTYRPELSIQDALDCARRSLASGRAYSVLTSLRAG
jgi:anthranilate phosphoribosyltransferase